MARTLLVLVLLVGCGAEVAEAPTEELGALAGPALVEALAAPEEVAPVEDAGPPALAELPALAINGSFESWTALAPAACSASWMDGYTSWCSSSAPPDGWSVRTGPAWGVLMGRWWETSEGVSSPSAVKHSVWLRGGCATPSSYTYCVPTALAGPAAALPVGTTSVRARWSVMRRPDGIRGSTVEATAARLRVEWLGAGCSQVLGSGTVEAPSLPPAWTWTRADAVMDVPAGTACVRLVVEADVSGRGLGLDGVELVPLR